MTHDYTTNTAKRILKEIQEHSALTPSESLNPGKTMQSQSQKHTPGPWKANMGDSMAIIKAGSLDVAHVYDPDDALLIAAAPELLEALKECEHALNGLLNQCDEQEKTESFGREMKAAEIARIAIARASGQ